MSVATLAAEGRFRATLRPALDLIVIHKRNPNPGQRVEDLSLNRGAVVFAVAAWQTYVESLTEAILAYLAPLPTDPAAGMYRLLAGRIRDQIKRLNTPDARNSIDLLALVGFDPTPAWTFTFEWERQVVRGHPSYTSNKTFGPGEAQKELDRWMLVRHKIAHGDTLPNDQELVSGRSFHGEPRVKRENAARCTSFFGALVAATSAEAHATFP